MDKSPLTEETKSQLSISLLETAGALLGEKMDMQE
jgi:hypothetical protein